MAIFYYEPGELSSGFVGYRVVKNANVCSSSPKYKQRWFSINEMMPNVAEELAKQQEELWQAEVEVEMAQRKIKPGGVRECKGIPIATNLQLCYVRAATGYRVAFRLTFANRKQHLRSVTKGYYEVAKEIMVMYANEYGLTEEQLKFYETLIPTHKDVIRHICTRFQVSYKHTSATETLRIFKQSLSEEDRCIL